jgi:predicted nucleic acid-binding protein
LNVEKLPFGLCKAVDDKKIKFDDAIEVFNAERLKIATAWANQAKKNQIKKGLSI